MEKQNPYSFIFISSNFHFPLINALVYVDIDQGIHKGKMKVALNEKRKILYGFSFSINVANFEAFLWRIKLTKNLWFLKSIRRRMKIESHSIIINVIELFVFLWPNICMPFGHSPTSTEWMSSRGTAIFCSFQSMMMQKKKQYR